MFNPKLCYSSTSFKRKMPICTPICYSFLRFSLSLLKNNTVNRIISIASIILVDFCFLLFGLGAAAQKVQGLKNASLWGSRSFCLGGPRVKEKEAGPLARAGKRGGVSGLSSLTPPYLYLDHMF